MEKLGAAVKIVELKKSIEDRRDEMNAKKTEISTKESEIDTLIKEILAKKREQLKDYHLEKGFAKTTSEDNRRTISEL